MERNSCCREYGADKTTQRIGAYFQVSGFGQRMETVYLCVDAVERLLNERLEQCVVITLAYYRHKRFEYGLQILQQRQVVCGGRKEYRKFLAAVKRFGIREHTAGLAHIIQQFGRSVR